MGKGDRSGEDLEQALNLSGENGLVPDRKKIVIRRPFFMAHQLSRMTAFQNDSFR
jgi:hypothetical protein